MDKRIRLTFLILFASFTLAHGQITQVYDLSLNEKTLRGNNIRSGDHLDQPLEILHLDTNIVVVNDFGDFRISVFDKNFNFIKNTLESSTIRPENLFYNDGSLCFISSNQLLCYDLNDLITNSTTKAISQDFPLLSNYNGHLQLISENRFCYFNPTSYQNERIHILAEDLSVLRSFGQIPSYLVDSTLRENYYLMSTSSIDTEGEAIFIGYKYCDYLEKYETKTGKRISIAHEISSQFPPNYKVSINGIGFPEDDFSYYVKLKTFKDRLYALYKYGVPYFPTETEVPMRLLVFDTRTLELIDQYILDEDLIDLAIRNEDEFIGLCYYCDDPLRLYKLK